MARNSRSSASAGGKAEAYSTYKGNFNDTPYTIDFYKRDNKKLTCKITSGPFCIYGKVYFSDNYCSILYPSYKGKDGKYVNQAFCFDSNEIKKINGHIDKILEDLGW